MAAKSAAPSPAPSEPPACGTALSELKAELAKTPGSCKSDADCTCYPGGTSITGCGGVSNLELAKRIGEITQKIRGLGCPGRVDCAAYACKTKCQAGSCSAAH